LASYQRKSNFKDSKYLEKPIVLGRRDEFLLIYVPVSGVMSYSSSNNYIGLYQNDTKVDDLKIGSIPMELICWDSDSITLIGFGEQNYVSDWIERIEVKEIGDFDLIWKIED
jgi:hypothetical protein